MELLSTFVIFAVISTLTTGQFTDEQKKTITQNHNTLRKKVKACNMVELEWDDRLATAAQQLCDGCVDGHKQPAGFTPPNGWTIGQNILYQQGSVDPMLAPNAWFNEGQYWNDKTNKCDSGAECGHFTQVTIGSMSAVGCGYKLCPSFETTSKTEAKTKTTLQDVHFIICNYNAVTTQPAVYTLGPPCTCCDKNFFCNNGYCRPSCEAPGDKCECYAKYNCKMCSEVDEEKCTCKCKPGYFGKHCSVDCVDKEGTDMYTACTEDYKFDPEGYCNPKSPDTQPYILKNCLGTCAGTEFKQCEKQTAENKLDPENCVVPSPPTEPDTTTTPDTDTKTTTTPDTSQCKDFKCVNGKALPGCKCGCDDGWQGNTCEHSVEEAKHGVILKIKTPSGSWDEVLKALKEQIPKSVSEYCNANFGMCCQRKGARKNPGVKYDITSKTYLHVGKGYPRDIQATIEVLIYVKTDEDNELCADGSPKGRRKRATDQDKGVFLPQDALLNALKADKAALEKKLKDCCNAELQGVEKSKIIPKDDGTGASGAGLKDWEIALIVLGVLLLVFFIVVLVYFILKSEYIRPKEEAEATQMQECQGQNKISPTSSSPPPPCRHAKVTVQQSNDLNGHQNQYQVYM